MNIAFEVFAIIAFVVCIGLCARTFWFALFGVITYKYTLQATLGGIVAITVFQLFTSF